MESRQRSARSAGIAQAAYNRTLVASGVASSLDAPSRTSQDPQDPTAEFEPPTLATASAKASDAGRELARVHNVSPVAVREEGAAPAVAGEMRPAEGVSGGGLYEVSMGGVSSISPVDDLAGGEGRGMSPSDAASASAASGASDLENERPAREVLGVQGGGVEEGGSGKESALVREREEEMREMREVRGVREVDVSMISTGSESALAYRAAAESSNAVNTSQAELVVALERELSVTVRALQRQRAGQERVIDKLRRRLDQVVEERDDAVKQLQRANVTSAQLTEDQARADYFRAALDTQTKSLLDLENESKATRHKLDTANQTLLKVDEARMAAENRAQDAEARRVDADKRARASDDALTNLNRRLSEAHATIAKQASEIERLAGERSEQQAAADLEGKLLSLEGKLRSAQEAARSHESALVKARKEVEREKQRADQLDAAFDSRIVEFAGTKAAYEAQVADLQKQLQSSQAKLDGVVATMEEQREALRHAARYAENTEGSRSRIESVDSGFTEEIRAEQSRAAGGEMHRPAAIETDNSGSSSLMQHLVSLGATVATQQAQLNALMASQGQGAPAALAQVADYARGAQSAIVPAVGETPERLTAMPPPEASPPDSGGRKAAVAGVLEKAPEEPPADHGGRRAPIARTLEKAAVKAYSPFPTDGNAKNDSRSGSAAPEHRSSRRRSRSDSRSRSHRRRSRRRSRRSSYSRDQSHRRRRASSSSWTTDTSSFSHSVTESSSPSGGRSSSETPPKRDRSSTEANDTHEHETAPASATANALAAATAAAESLAQLDSLVRLRERQLQLLEAATAEAATPQRRPPAPAGQETVSQGVPLAQAGTGIPVATAYVSVQQSPTIPAGARLGGGSPSRQSHVPLTEEAVRRHLAGYSPSRTAPARSKRKRSPRTTKAAKAVQNSANTSVAARKPPLHQSTPTVTPRRLAKGRKNAQTRRRKAKTKVKQRGRGPGKVHLGVGRSTTRTANGVTSVDVTMPTARASTPPAPEESDLEAQYEAMRAAQRGDGIETNSGLMLPQRRHADEHVATSTLLQVPDEQEPEWKVGGTKFGHGDGMWWSSGTSQTPPPGVGAPAPDEVQEHSEPTSPQEGVPGRSGSTAAAQDKVSSYWFPADMPAIAPPKSTLDTSASAFPDDTAEQVADLSLFDGPSVDTSLLQTSVGSSPHHALRSMRDEYVEAISRPMPVTSPERVKLDASGSQQTAAALRASSGSGVSAAVEKPNVRPSTMREADLGATPSPSPSPSRTMGSPARSEGRASARSGRRKVAGKASTSGVVVSVRDNTGLFSRASSASAAASPPRERRALRESRLVLRQTKPQTKPAARPKSARTNAPQGATRNEFSPGRAIATRSSAKVSNKPTSRMQVKSDGVAHWRW